MNHVVDTRKLRIALAVCLGVVGALISLCFNAPGIGLVLGLLFVCVELCAENQLVLSGLEREAGRTNRVFLGNSLFPRLARKKLTYIRELVGDYERGVLHLFDLPECLDVYPKFLDAATANGHWLLAASMVDPQRIWEGEPREANRRFLARGGKIARIFFAGDEADLWKDAALQAELNRQSEMGVEVLVCFKEAITNKALVCDFVLHPDDRMALEYSTAPDVTPWAGKLIADKDAVARLHGNFDQLRAVARRWETLRAKALQGTSG
jgi:hypothetical protein